jgi:hypothetical protein
MERNLPIKIPITKYQTFPSNILELTTPIIQKLKLNKGSKMALI